MTKQSDAKGGQIQSTFIIGSDNDVEALVFGNKER